MTQLGRQIVRSCASRAQQFTWGVSYLYKPRQERPDAAHDSLPHWCRVAGHVLGQESCHSFLVSGREPTADDREGGEPHGVVLVTQTTGHCIRVVWRQLYRLGTKFPSLRHSPHNSEPAASVVILCTVKESREITFIFDFFHTVFISCISVYLCFQLRW